MSAAATAAGYLYASGRLRGREKREGESDKPETPHEPNPRPRSEKPIRVAAMPAQDDLREKSGPRKTPTIQYRTRRWKPEPHGE